LKQDLGKVAKLIDRRGLGRHPVEVLSLNLREPMRDQASFANTPAAIQDQELSAGSTVQVIEQIQFHLASNKVHS
jgi:hypothetical protein